MDTHEGSDKEKNPLGATVLSVVGGYQSAHLHGPLLVLAAGDAPHTFYWGRGGGWQGWRRGGGRVGGRAGEAMEVG